MAAPANSHQSPQPNATTYARRNDANASRVSGAASTLAFAPLAETPPAAGFAT